MMIAGVANVSSANTEAHRAVQQLKLDVSAPASLKLVTQTELNAMIDR